MKPHQLPFYNRRFSILFFSILIVSVLHVFVQGDLGNRILSGFSVLVLLSAIYSVYQWKLEICLAVILVLPLLYVAAFGDQAINETVITVIASVYMIFLGYTVFVILKYVLTQETVTSNSVFGSLCVYLLLGYIWSLVYLLIEFYVPGSFMSNVSPLNIHGSSFSDIINNFIYFSFVTLATLGYGDIVPMTEESRMIAVFEAICGQLFLVVLVANLVGRHSRRGRSR